MEPLVSDTRSAGEEDGRRVGSTHTDHATSQPGKMYDTLGPGCFCFFIFSSGVFVYFCYLTGMSVCLG